MSTALHFVVRTADAQRSLHAQDLVRDNPALEREGPKDGHLLQHRVVELSFADAVQDPVDLRLDERELPELHALLQTVDEVHLHGIDIDLFLQQFPYVRPDVLEHTPLTIHGPCARSPQDLPPNALARLEQWPGPLELDRRASLTLGRDVPEQAQTPDRWMLDPWDLSLTPRVGAAGPIPGLAQDDAVVVCLSRRIPPHESQQLRQRVEALFQASAHGVDVAWIEESAITREQARSYRRLAQVYVARSWSDESCPEAMLSKTPLWVLDVAPHSLAPWWQSVGVDTAAHRLPALDDPDFDQTWTRAIERWGQGQTLEASQRLRELVLERCWLA